MKAYYLLDKSFKWNIIQKITEQIDIFMPQYYSLKGCTEIGDITVTPVHWYRKYEPFKTFFPYFVGDEVEFRLQIENPSYRFCLYEIFGDNYSEPQNIVKDGIMLGHRITKEGDVEYKIALKGNPFEGFPIFTTRVINKDRFGLTCLGMMLGAFLTFLFMVLLGFLQIVPVWRIWIP